MLPFLAMVPPLQLQQHLVATFICLLLDRTQRDHYEEEEEDEEDDEDDKGVE